MVQSILLIEEDYNEFQHIKQELEDLSYNVLPEDFVEMAKAFDPFCKGNIEDYIFRQIKIHHEDLGLVLLSENYLLDDKYAKKIAKKIREFEGVDPVYVALLPIVIIDHTPLIKEAFLYEGVDYVYKPDYEDYKFSTIIDSQTIKFEKSIKKINSLFNKINIPNIKPKVFIVHGRSHFEEVVANVLDCLGLDPIILREQANQGMTLIEKIEQYSDVSYALVLYTPCDEGKLKDAPNEKLRPRARQNVVFEHGYLMSKLGREKVCALVEEDVETPGDTSGIVYLPLDKKNKWLDNLVKEFEASGIVIDHRLIRKAKNELFYSL